MGSQEAAIDPAYAQFFQSFYQISDTPEAHELYADQFTKDATLIMASKKAEGFDDILALRKAIWLEVASRDHRPAKLFPFGLGSDELMLYGTVNYVRKDGRKALVDWAARALMTKSEGPVKMKFYQVYLDSAAQQNAK